MDGLTALSASPVFVGTGQLAKGRKSLEDNVGAPPTTSATAQRNAALGVIASVEGRDQEALSLLGQAVTQQPSTSSFIPDSTVALAALTMLHSGDTARARSILTGAIRADRRHDVFGVRHRLLAAWIAMLSGDLSGAVQWLPGAQVELSRRDRLFAESLRTGIARRHGDTGPLRQHWQASMDALSAYSIDLYTLLPVGELWVAAARLRTLDVMTHHLDRAFAVLAHLGDPIAWSAPLRWAGVHAAILTNSPENLAPHGQALAAGRVPVPTRAYWRPPGAPGCGCSPTTWTARRWTAPRACWPTRAWAGMPPAWPVRPHCTRTTRRSRPRCWRSREISGRRPPRQTASPHPPRRCIRRRPHDCPSASARSLNQLLRGLPYRDIGAQLFISAKTVEHHVARIRRRLGAESRSDMFSMLRAILTP